MRFENTTNRTQVTKYYVVTGVPVHKDKYMPHTVCFTFVDGDFQNLTVHGKLITLDGSVSDKVIVKLTDFYTWDQDAWPDWLKKLRDVAFYEFATGNVANYDEMTYEEAVNIANGN